MKSCSKGMVVIFILMGYMLNLYYLTVDSKVRDYGWINKVGIIIVPLGSVMGYVYLIDKKELISE